MKVKHVEGTCVHCNKWVKSEVRLRYSLWAFFILVVMLYGCCVFHAKRWSFDYVIGRYSDDITCIYAWQLIEKRRFDTLTTHNDVAVQLRYCSPDGDTLKLASILSNLKFNI